MKIFRLLIVAGLMASSSYAQTVKEALQNPLGAKTIVLNGQPGEAALFAKNGTRFKNVSTVIISGISDSVQAEQDLISIAACSSVKKVSIEKCGFRFLSGAIRMLVAVNEVSVQKCNQLDPAQAFSTLSQMPSLQKLDYSAANMKSIPRSFARLRLLEEIRIHNEDISIADGYARNTHAPAELLAEKNFQLGFGTDILLLSYSCYNETFAATHIGLMRDLLQGVAFDGNEMKLPQPPTAFKANHPLVKPPVAGLDIAPNVYTADAKNGGLLEYPSGTKIIIPQNAFVDKAGNPVSGNVTISYREFRDPVDIMLSGIPMKYDSAGQSEDFESAGMFEMNASVNGEEVFLAPGKKVDMDFAVVDTASTYNFYRLDEQKGWQYLQPTGKTEVKSDAAVSTATAQQSSTAITSFVNRTRWWSRPRLDDTISFENMYADTNYFYTTNDKSADWLFANTRAEWKRSTYWRMQKVPSQRGTNCFVLFRYKMNRNNVEMSEYRNFTWMFNDPIDKKSFMKLRSSRSGINDIRMIYNGGSSFTMELKQPGGFVSYSVTAVKVIDHKPVPVSEEMCSMMNSRYEKALARRSTRHTRKVNDRITKFNRRILKLSRDSVIAWRAVRKDMSPEELAMNFRQWANYARPFGAFNFYAVSAEASRQSSAIYQALSIQGFGVYNCDQIRRIQNPVQVFALAYSQDGVQENVTQMFVLVPGKNQAFSYTGEAGKPVQIAFGANDANKLLAINEDGSVSFCDAETFNKRTDAGNGNTRFQTLPLSDKPLSVQELRAIIYPDQVAEK